MPTTLIKSAKIRAFDLTHYSEELLHFWLEIQDQVNKHIHMGDKLLDEEQKPVQELAKYIQRRLYDFIQLQMKQVEQAASLPQQQLYQKSLYAHAALIDEQILNQLEWKISDQWIVLMMEQTLFESRNAGVKLIDEMEEFAALPHNFTVDEKKLAEIYIKIIWLGFVGKYQDKEEKSGDNSNIAELVEALYKSAELFVPDVEQRQLIEQAYKYNNNPQKQSRLAPLRRWYRYGLYCLLGYLLVSSFSWFVITIDLDRELTLAEDNHVKRTHSRRMHGD